MRNAANVLGVPVDKLTMDQVVDKVVGFLKNDKAHMVFTPNAEIIMMAVKDPELMHILKIADLNTADGAGIILASRVLGLGIPEKVSGIDLVFKLFEICAANGNAFWFLGGKPGIAEEAARNMTKQFPLLKVSGYANGYFDYDEQEEFIKKINASGAEILLVAFGVPKQEKWIYKNKDRLNVKVCIGIGGSLDIFAGAVKRAPKFIRKNGFEWLYRLYREPWRYKRVIKLPLFVISVITQKIKGIKGIKGDGSF